LVVGDVDGNTSRIVAAAAAARDQHHADVVLVPELAVSGYPPEDLLFHSGMRLQVGRSLDRLKQEVRGITLIAAIRNTSDQDFQFGDRGFATAPCSPIIARPVCRTTGCSTKSAILRPAPNPLWSTSTA